MLDTPRTVREWIDSWKWDMTKRECQDSAFAQEINAFIDDMKEDAAHFGISLDALIGAQGRVVYTAEDVEAAAKVYCKADYDETGIGFDLLWRDDEAHYLEVARSVLTAAGGVVADEVVEVSDDDGTPCPNNIIFLVPGDEEYSFAELCVGNKLYIVRTKGVHRDPPGV